MKKLILASLAFAAIGLSVGFAVTWVALSGKEDAAILQTVAMKWGDGKYGPGFYGARVYLEPRPQGYSVKACVYISPDNGGYRHDCGELGVVDSHEEAVRDWGTITWKEEGLYIGKGGDADFFVPRKTIESHR
jgi:hypothetical protein